MRSFNRDSEGKLNGELVDGVFVPLQAAPTGDDLDLLLDECCVIVENTFKAFGKLDTELKMDDGQHSLVLSDGETRIGIRRGHRGVRSWIVEGTLRSGNQLTPILNAFLSDMKTKVRLRKMSPDWKFDSDCLIVIGSRFGLDAPRTLAELQAKRAAERLERDRQQQEREAQRQAEQQAFKASEAGRQQTQRMAVKYFKEDTIRAVVDALVEHVASDGTKITPEMTEEERTTAIRRANGDALEHLKECRRVEKVIRPIVESSPLSADAIVRIYNEAEDDWIEAEEWGTTVPLEDYINRRFARFVAAANQPATWGPVMIPPLMDGVERHLFESMKKYGEFFEHADLDKKSFVARVDFGGNVVVDVVPEELEDTYNKFCATYEAREHVNA